jgi:hypothetical protein
LRSARAALLTLVFAGLAGEAAAQDATLTPAAVQFPGIRGQLTSTAGGPVQAARVATDDNLFETWSLADGRFWLEGVPPGSIHLVVEADGFLPLAFTVELLPGMAPDLTFVLTPGKTPKSKRPRGDDSVTVRAKRKPTGLTRYTLERETLRQVPGTFGDPLRAIQNLPGFNRAPYGLGVLLVRGTGPNDSSTFIDGHEIPLLYHFLAGPSVLAPDMLGRIDYLPGNFSARYGRAIGGVLDVTTRRGDSDHWMGSADLDFFDAGLFAQGPVGDDTNIAVAGRRSYVDAVIQGAAAASGAEPSALLLPVYWDYQARVDHRLSSKQRLSALFFGSEDHFSLVGDPGGNGPDGGAEARLGFHRAKLDWDADFGKGTTLNISPVVGVDVSSVSADTITVDALVWEYALRVDLSLRPIDTITVKTGLDLLGRYADLTAELPFRLPNYRPYPGGGFLNNEPQKITRDVAVHQLAAYGEATWAPEDTGFSLTPGLRIDSFTASAEPKLMLDPRVNVRQKVADEITLKAGAGVFSQPPTEFRLDEDLGNPDLTAEWADQYALGVEVQTDEATTLSAEVYYARRHDLVQRVEDVEITEDGPAPTRFDNVGLGRSYGFELMLRRETSKSSSGWISYSASRAEEKEGPDAPWQRVFSDQTHHVVAVWTTKLPAGWSVGTRVQLVSGSPLTTYDGGVFNSDTAGFDPIVPADDGRSHQSLFHQVDLRVDKTWVGDVVDVTAYLDLINIENAHNPEFLQWDYRFREFAFVRGLPILPSLGVQAVLK